MNKFDLNPAKTTGNNARALKATTSLAGALALGVGVGLGAAALAPAYADDATSTGTTATADVNDDVQGATTAHQVILIDGGGTVHSGNTSPDVYTYDGTSDTSASINSIGFVDADEDGVPLGSAAAGATTGDDDDTDATDKTVTTKEIIAGTLNVLGGTSSNEATVKAVSSETSSATLLKITDSIGGTYSYTDGNGDTQTDGTASLTTVNVIGQEGTGDLQSFETAVHGGSSTLEVGDNIYASDTNVSAGDGGVAPINSTIAAGDGGDATLKVGGNVVGNLVVTGGSGTEDQSRASTYGTDGGNANADIEGNIVGNLAITGGDTIDYGGSSAATAGGRFCNSLCCWQYWG